jgi:hypothetical protein
VADHSEEHLLDVTSSDVSRFVNALPLDNVTDLSAFCNRDFFHDSISAARSSFAGTLETAEAMLNDPNIALAVFRLPLGTGISARSDALLRATLSVAIGGCLVDASMNIDNGTPFSLAKTSRQNSDKVTSLGISASYPERVHNLHNDVLIDLSTEEVLLPDRLVLHNIHIGFKNSGDLLWLPYRRWSDFKDFQEEFGLDRQYRFHLNPLQSQNGTPGSVKTHTISAPVFSVTSQQQPLVFMGGSIDDAPGDMALRMRASLAECSGHIVVPQSTNQVVALANKYGFHGRIAFEDPTDGMRLLLRMIDSRGTRVAQGFA